MSDAIRTQLEENAQAPRAIETDGLRVTEHSIRDQIEADKYLGKVSNRSSSKLPIRVARVAASRPVR